MTCMCRPVHILNNIIPFAYLNLYVRFHQIQALSLHQTDLKETDPCTMSSARSAMTLDRESE